MRYKCLVAAILVTVAIAPLPAQSVRAGIEAWQRADYAGATAIWRPLAEKGDANAAFNLGQAYRLGRGVPQDMAAAQGWFERAARQGNVEAQAVLGLMLFAAGNQAGGLRWLKLAALKEEPRAMLAYGTALFNGEGIPRDPLLGYRYVLAAAETGLEPARETLQRLDEIIPAQDRERASRLTLPRSEEASSSAAGSHAKAAPRRSLKVAAGPPASSPAAKRALPPLPAAVQKTLPAARGDWRIQLGAFSKRSAAEALFGKLSGKAALNGRRVFYIPFGAITRLQVGPFESPAAAQAACNALRPQPCFPVVTK